MEPNDRELKLMYVSRAVRIVLTVVFCLSLTAALRAQSAPPIGCRQLDAAVKERVAHVAARMLRLEPVIPEFVRETLVRGTCYHQVFLAVPNTNRQLTIYISPDSQYAFSTLWDISHDAEKEEMQLAAQLAEDAAKDGAPAEGPDSASISVVVFSDFQCPHCATFARILDRYNRDNPDKIRLVFRNMPVMRNGWSMQAARAGACIYHQSNVAFWRFQDEIFARQKDITQETLWSVVDDFVSQHKDVRRDGYLNCMASAYPDERLQHDLDRATSLEVHGTPTVFINGRRFSGFRDDDAFNAAIRESGQTQPVGVTHLTKESGQ